MTHVNMGLIIIGFGCFLYVMLASFGDGFEGMPAKSLRRMRGSIFYPTMIAVLCSIAGMVLNVMPAGTGTVSFILQMTGAIVLTSSVPSLAFRLGAHAHRKSLVKH